jgi:hypothetical protein
MNRATIFTAVGVMTCFLSIARANDSIVVSDGPGTGTAHPKIVTTDGPAKLAYVYPPPIIISNGPAKLFYERATNVVTSDGPSGVSAPAQKSTKVFIIDGAEPVHLAKHAPKKLATKKLAAKKKQPLPDPETSTLAPAIPTVSPVTPPSPVAPPIQNPASSPVSSGAPWTAIAILGTLAVFLFGAFLWIRRKT